MLFSSISGLIGSRWLAHYAATTTFLDTFAYARRAAGLPATAVNWGLWKSLADNQTEQERQVTLDSGLEPMPDEVAIQALRSVTRARCPGPVHRRGRGLDPAGHRLSHPSSAAHRRRPAAAETPTTTGDAPSAPKTEFREALRDCEPTDVVTFWPTTSSARSRQRWDWLRRSSSIRRRASSNSAWIR